MLVFKLLEHAIHFIRLRVISKMIIEQFAGSMSLSDEYDFVQIHKIYHSNNKREASANI